MSECLKCSVCRAVMMVAALVILVQLWTLVLPMVAMRPYKGG